VTLISLEAAIAIGEGSRRTWWRRISDNAALKKGTDSRGRTMISYDAASEFIPMPIDQDALGILIAADAGDSDAQNDAGLLFSEVENQKAAVYWWRAAADQGHPDAMHHLGRCYTGGLGVSTDENIGIMWIAKAAASGHVIAQLQMKGLRPFIDWRTLELPDE
jgi:hypothetical protein